MNRRDWLAAAVACAVTAARAQAPRPAGMRRMGILTEASRDEEAEGQKQFVRAIEPLGWFEGRNIEYVFRFSDGVPERLPQLALELVAERVDVLNSAGTRGTRALQEATRTIPIFAIVGDPVGTGFARSLARPGGNITGLSLGTNEVAAKQIELLRAILPGLAHVTVLGNSPPRIMRELTAPLELAARQVGVVVELRRVTTQEEVEEALRAIPGGGRGAAIPGNHLPADVPPLALRLKVPTMFHNESFVAAGGLMSFSLEYENLIGRIAAINDKLLRGADPAGTPFELPTRSNLAINRTTAAALGLAIPREVLLLANRVIG